MSIKQNILVTADVLVFGTEQGERKYLLLIQRKNDPFRGQWAFPGGFVEDDEDLDKAAARELQEETGLNVEVDKLEQVGAWGTPGRDPRGRTVTIAFTTTLDVKAQKVAAADDAGDARWWPLEKLPQLAFDHDQILHSVLEDKHAYSKQKG